MIEIPKQSPETADFAKELAQLKSEILNNSNKKENKEAKDKIAAIQKNREQIDPRKISEVIVDPKFKCVDFKYGDSLYIKFEPRGFVDVITFYDMTKKEKCSMEFNGSLFRSKGVEEPRYVNVATQNRFLLERLDITANFYQEAMKTIKQRELRYDVEGDPMIIYKNAAFFTAEKKMDTTNKKYKEGEENMEYTRFKITYNKTEGSYGTEEITEDTYDKAINPEG